MSHIHNVYLIINLTKLIGLRTQRQFLLNKLISMTKVNSSNKDLFNIVSKSNKTLMKSMNLLINNIDIEINEIYSNQTIILSNQ